MVGGKQIPPQDSRRGVLVRRRKGIPGKDEASLRPDAIVASPPQRQGSGDERSDKNGRTALDARFRLAELGVCLRKFLTTPTPL